MRTSLGIKGCLAALIVFLGFAVAVPANAQEGPCRGQPGEVQVALINGVPICRYPVEQQQQQPQYAPPIQPVAAHKGASFAAIAWHRDARQTWIGKEYRRQNDAENETLAACNATMGGGCEILGTLRNIYFVVAFDSYGSPVYSSGADRKQATSDLKKYCAEQKRKSCTIVQEGEVIPFLDFAGARDPMRPSLIAPQGDYRRRWAAAAMPEGVTPFRPHGDVMWVQGGFQNEASAKQAVLAMCEAKTKVKCQVEQTAMDITLFIGWDQKNVRRVFVAPPRDGAAKLKRSCVENKDKCVVVVEYASDRRDVLEVQLGEEAWKRSKGKIGYQIGADGQVISPTEPPKT